MVAEGCWIKKKFFKIIVSQLNREAVPIRKPSAVPNKKPTPERGAGVKAHPVSHLKEDHHENQCYSFAALFAPIERGGVSFFAWLL
jgi:hypothetical protein